MTGFPFHRATRSGSWARKLMASLVCSFIGALLQVIAAAPIAAATMPLAEDTLVSNQERPSSSVSDIVQLTGGKITFLPEGPPSSGFSGPVTSVSLTGPGFTISGSDPSDTFLLMEPQSCESCLPVSPPPPVSLALLDILSISDETGPIAFDTPMTIFVNATLAVALPPLPPVAPTVTVTTPFVLSVAIAANPDSGVAAFLATGTGVATADFAYVAETSSWKLLRVVYAVAKGPKKPPKPSRQ
jgi:hypothetical protein